MHRRRRRDRHLRRLSGVRLEELEVLDHRMAVEVAELPRHANENLLRLHAALEGDLALAGVGLDARQRRDEIGLPGLAAVLAVGDRLQADRLLLLDQDFDLAVLDRLQLLGRDFVRARAWRAPPSARRAQQAADVVGAEWGLGALHWCFTVPEAPSPGHSAMTQGGDSTPTIIRSFAHCSSSARMLPSSVEAKPHCGDRQS